jgi:hypothetical protein
MPRSVGAPAGAILGRQLDDLGGRVESTVALPTAVLRGPASTDRSGDTDTTRGQQVVVGRARVHRAEPADLHRVGQQIERPSRRTVEVNGTEVALRMTPIL